MNWLTGLRRLRLVATVALIVGVALGASVLLTRTLGYAPDTSVASLFGAMWPTGLALVILGGVLWVAVWVLQGFVPAAQAGVRTGEPVARRAHLDE